MKAYSIVYILLIALASMACKEEKKNTESEVTTVQETSESEAYSAAKMEAQFNDPKVQVIFEEYIQLKMALVNTNNANTVLAAKSLHAKLLAIDAQKDLINVVKGISETNDIEMQRKAFVAVTAAVEIMLEGALNSGTIYKQFCPMAFNNTGAYWLSNSREVQNPYFGDKMLKCGRVAAEIQ